MSLFNIIKDKIFGYDNWATIKIEIGERNFDFDKILDQVSTFKKKIEYCYEADPFAINNEIYYEYIGKFGVIGKIYKKKFGDLQGIPLEFPAAEMRNHKSFPVVFSFGFDQYIMPQISGLYELWLYKLVDNKAERYLQIASGEYHDCTIKIDMNYVNVYLYSKKDPKELNILKIDLTQKLIISKNKLILNNNNNNYNECRPAGKVFYWKSLEIIPIQNSKGRYGSGLVLCEIVENMMVPLEFKIENFSNITGVHTLNVYENYALMDYRWRSYGLLGLIKKIKKTFMMFINYYLK